MANWKERLYKSYISSGQVKVHDDSDKMVLKNYKYYIRLIKKYIPKNYYLKICDLGCGHGALLYCLKEYGYRNIIGVDISKEQVSYAHKNGIYEVAEGEINKFLERSDQIYDVVFLMDILEHLDKDEIFIILDLINTRLSDGGLLIIHVPNADGIFGMKMRYGDFTHETCFNSDSLSQILHVCGFKDAKFIEDSPIVHGYISFIRNILWNLLTLPYRLLAASETGNFKRILSQNMLAIAKKNNSNNPID